MCVGQLIESQRKFSKKQADHQSGDANSNITNWGKRGTRNAVKKGGGVARSYIDVKDQMNIDRPPNTRGVAGRSMASSPTEGERKRKGDWE